MSSSTALAASYYQTLDRPYSTDLLADQHLGGGITWALGGVPILLVMAAVFVQWVRSDAREAARADRDGDRARPARGARAGQVTAPGTSAEPGTAHNQYNDYLARSFPPRQPQPPERTTT